MGTLLVVLGVLAVVVAGNAAWLSARVRRLEARVSVQRGALEMALLGRAAAAAVLARATGSDALADAADRSLAGPPDRVAAENALSRSLRQASGPAEPVAGTLAATAKLRYARQFHNDAVRDLRALRSRWLVRTLGLARRRPLPDFFEVDDGAEPTLTPDAASGPVPLQPATPDQRR